LRTTRTTRTRAPQSLCATQQHTQDDTAFEDRPQRYRQSLGKLQAALADLQQQTPHVQFVLTLGDIIDGYAGQQERSNADLQHVAKLFDAALPGLPVYHTLGNHCCAASRSELLKVCVYWCVRMCGC
jgi:uncharacterized protein YukE